MFIFISGFLFGGQLLRKQPVSFARMVKNKFMRLMLPFFVFTVFFMLTTNSLSWEPFYRWTYWHLWFLPMLFWCFIITYFLRPLILSDKLWIGIATLVALFGISLIGKVVPMIIGLHNVHTSICWFALGVWLYRHEHLLDGRKTKIYVALLGGVLYVTLCYFFPMEYGQRTVLGELAGMCGIASMWCLVNLFKWADTRATRTIIAMSGASFGIYIFHNWVEMHILSRTAQRLLPIESFAAGHTIIFPLAFCIIAFGVSYVLTTLMLKTKIGKNLIG